MMIHTGVPPDLIHQTFDLQTAFYRLGDILYCSPEWPKDAPVGFTFLIETQYFTWTPAGLFHEPILPGWETGRNRGIPLAVWVHDCHLNFHKQIPVAKECDVVFVSPKPWLEEFKSDVNPNSHWLNAAAVNIALMPPPGIHIDEEYDVGFVGAVSHPYYEDRQRLLGKIKEAGLKVFVHDSTIQSPLYRQDMIAAYSRCKIIFNYVRPDTQGTGNARIYEAITARKLLLTNKLPGIYDLGFRPGVHYAEYGSDKECVELAKHYAADREERRSIAEWGIDYGLKEHSWESRAKKILEIMGPVLR